jgi:hypothetical protein
MRLLACTRLAICTIGALSILLACSAERDEQSRDETSEARGAGDRTGDRTRAGSTGARSSADTGVDSTVAGDRDSTEAAAPTPTPRPTPIDIHDLQEKPPQEAIAARYDDVHKMLELIDTTRPQVSQTDATYVMAALEQLFLEFQRRQVFQSDSEQGAFEERIEPIREQINKLPTGSQQDAQTAISVIRRQLNELRDYTNQTYPAVASETQQTPAP